MPAVMMMCGHSTTAVNAATKEPVCVICLGGPKSQEARTVMSEEQTAALVKDRMMRCSYLHGRNRQPCAGRLNPIPSDPMAAFFRSKPGEEFDEYYDGCWGWD